MIVLKAVKDMKLNGKFIHAGEYVRTENPEQFLKGGYARYLAKNESGEILNEYVRFAYSLFPEEQQRKEMPQRPPRIKWIKEVFF